MGDIGLEGAYGGVGMSDALNQAQNLRLKLWQLSEQQRIANTELGQRQQGLDETHADRLARIADTGATAKAADQTRMLNFANLRPIGSNVTPQEYTKETALGNPTGNYATTPSLPATRTAGLTSLAPGLTSMGTEAPPQTPPKQAAVTSEAPIDPLGKISFGGTQAQIEKQAADQRAEAAATEANRHNLALEEKTKPENPGVIHDTAGGLVRIGPDNAVTPLTQNGKPVQTYRAPQQPIVIQTPAGPALLDRGKGTATPVKDASGAVVGPKLNATLENRLASAQAVAQTGNDIIASISDPATAAKLGPAMGRYNSVRDFIGNPPPEFAELAGSIESYALANMGVHGMRSTEGAEKINKMLSEKGTPESLIAKIHGLNKFSTHLLENAGKTAPAAAGPVKMRAPDGRPLSVPADKVDEMLGLGATKVQ